MKTKTKKTSAAAPEEELLPIPHPGETLQEDFMAPLGLSAYAVAKAIRATPITISMIVRGKRAISAELALRLGRYTGTEPEFWNNLQANYDLAVARREKEAEIIEWLAPYQKAA